MESEHIFLFPFTWRTRSRKNSKLFTKQTQLGKKEFERLAHWRVQHLKIEEDKDYNEYVYFYKPIRAALYSFEERPVIVRNYSYEALENDNYFRLKVGEQYYELRIEEITLKLYKTGIGILSLKVCNERYKAIEQIEAINCFSKCIYPPVLPLGLAREELFPQKIEIKLNERVCLKEDFSANYYKESLGISPLIMGILGPQFVGRAETCKENKIYIEPIIGNQMFCLCLYKNEEIVTAMKKGEVAYVPLERMMTVNHKINYHEIEENSNHIGSAHYLKSDTSIYGISRFALLGVSSKLPQSKLYDQLVSLVLMQRATLLSLSTEIALVSTMSKYDLATAIGGIYEIYIQFINQLYFKEVTEDTQGAYIYKKLSEELRVEEELEQVNYEIDEVHEYVSLVEQAESKVKVELLTIIGAALVLPSFVTSLFGMNIFQREILHWWNSISVALWMNSYVLLPILVVSALCTWNKRKSKWSLLMKAFYGLTIIGSIYVIYQYGCGL